MKPPAITICIPAFNQTEFLNRTLESISSQTFRDFEVIVTDDSTTQDVEKLVVSFESKFKIRYERNSEQLGSPANWNRALDMAQGDWIKFMHHDDWFSGPDSLRIFAEAANRDANFVFCDSEVLDVERQTTHVSAPSAQFLRILRSKPTALFASNFIGSPSATFFRRSPMRFDPMLEYVVDVDFYIRYLKDSRFVHIPAALIVNTSNHPGQVTSRSLGAEVQLREYLYLYDKVFDGGIPNLRLSGFFRRLFKKFGIHSAPQLSHLGIQLPTPRIYFQILMALSRF
jgi:glycosyltransferase involved in cell wall biosynthesis